MRALWMIALLLVTSCSDNQFSSETPDYAAEQEADDKTQGFFDPNNPQNSKSGKPNGDPANDADSRSEGDQDDDDDDDGQDGRSDRDRSDGDDDDADSRGDDDDDEGTDDARTPELTSLGGGDRGVAPDYSSCARLPQGGKRGYGKCSADEAVVIINDGKAQEMTCCPIGENVLSNDDSELHVLRQGVCDNDEIATGMKSPFAPEVYCSRVNTRYLAVEDTGRAQYVTRSSNAFSAELNQIASTYNVNDTCVCPDNQVMRGGHTARDNRCEDVCAKIVERD